MGCFWVIKINRVFLEALRGLIKAQSLGLPGERQANELAARRGEELLAVAFSSWWQSLRGLPWPREFPATVPKGKGWGWILDS